MFSKVWHIVWTLSLAVIISNVALVENLSKRSVTDELSGGSAKTSTWFNIMNIKQSFDHTESSFISQLIKVKSRDLQKLLKKCFNGTTISLSNVLLSVGVLLIIFV